MKTDPPKVTADMILAHVLRYREPHPLPLHTPDFYDEFNTLADGVDFEPAKFCSIHKLDLADWMALPADYISRWIANEGLGEAIDPKHPKLLVWWKAEAWIRENKAVLLQERFEAALERIRNQIDHEKTQKA
jgi:hypothetical protein